MDLLIRPRSHIKLTARVDSIVPRHLGGREPEPPYDLSLFLYVSYNNRMRWVILHFITWSAMSVIVLIF